MPYEESIFLKINETDTLHLRRFYKNPKSKPAFLVHGSIENGRIFYSKSGKGLAPFLAENGYDVYVVDLRGRGKSTPKISKELHYGLHEALFEDIATCLQYIRDKKGNQPQYWLSHSWGGVLLMSYFARRPEENNLAKMCFLATKRAITTQNLKKWWMIDVNWRFLGKILAKKYGFLPALKMKFGAENEPRQFFFGY